MQTVMCTNGGIGQLAAHRQPQAAFVPWWAGSQPVYGESFGQLKSLAQNCPNVEDQEAAASRQMHHAVDQGPGQGPAISDKVGGDTTRFSIIQGKNPRIKSLSYDL